TPVIRTSQNTASGCAQVNAKSYGLIHAVRPGIARCTVKIGAATAGRKKLRKRIIPAAIEAAEAGRPTIECIHPNKNPQTCPNPRRKYAYSPPASGIAAPSSAYDSAPKIESTAPTIHAANTIETERPSRAISAGFRKMPVPIIVPTTIAAEAHGPSPRTNSRRFSLIFLRPNSQPPSLARLSPANRHPAARRSEITRLTTAPTANVMHAPISTYHVNAIFVNRNTSSTVTSPANIPASDPLEFARASKVPSKNNPSELPNGREATVNPASSTGPHFTNPRTINTAPHTSVILRENFKKLPGSAECPRSAAKSMTLEAASEFSEPLALDIATARIDASSSPASPVGISRIRNNGKMRSVRSPAASSGVC